MQEHQARVGTGVSPVQPGKDARFATNRVTYWQLSRLNGVARILAFLLLTITAVAQQLPHEDAVRIVEFYRLATQIQDQIWPGWSNTPAPLLLVTDKTEFLTHNPAPPKDFTKVADGMYARPRQYNVHFQATFPAFGLPATIVIGQAQNTESKSSTPWLIAVMHEHFHQLQWAQPGNLDAVSNLGLSAGDTTGMWMLNYPFPYDCPEVVQSFSKLRDLLLEALAQTDLAEFKRIAAEYIAQRKRVFAQLSPKRPQVFQLPTLAGGNRPLHANQSRRGSRQLSPDR
jgi:hypothetical protein